MYVWVATVSVWAWPSLPPFSVLPYYTDEEAEVLWLTEGLPGGICQPGLGSFQWTSPQNTFFIPGRLEQRKVVKSLQLRNRRDDFRQLFVWLEAGYLSSLPLSFLMFLNEFGDTGDGALDLKSWRTWVQIWPWLLTSCVTVWLASHWTSVCFSFLTRKISQSVSKH